LLGVGLACAGCATSGGHDWLSSPIDAHVGSHADVVAFPATEMEPRPRLSHTVTLGETYAGEATRAAPSGGSPVEVSVHTQVPIVINNYGGYGYGFGGYGYGYGRGAMPRSASRRATSAAPLKVGGDFPAPPDHGPRALR
jgi:hypothetical protein